MALAEFTGIYASQWHPLMAAATVVDAPVLILFLVPQRYFIEEIFIEGSPSPASRHNSARAAAMQEPTRQIAFLMPAAVSYGLSEAGKRVRKQIVVAVDVSGEPVDGERWRWRTDAHSGWVYPPTGTTAADGRIAATWVAGTPGAA